MNTSTSPGEPPREPTPEEIARVLGELEQHVAEQAPESPAPLVPLAGGETKRVQKLRAEVAEAHLLAKLQDDDTPLLLDTSRVRKHRRKAAEAARLHRLAQDPMMRAYRAARTRRFLITVAMVALALALGWSTAGVQAFAADGSKPWTAGWVFAWLVEPFMSLALLVVVGARAYLSTLGQPIDSPTLVRIERLFLGLTLGMNAWPYLPWVADTFSFSRLVLHILGPIVAVAIVTALPIILAAFTRLDLGLAGTPSVPLRYRGNAQDQYTFSTAPVQVLVEHIRNMIAAGALAPNPGVHKIREALRAEGAQIGVDKAREVQKLLVAGDPS